MAALTPTAKPTFLPDTGPLSVLCSFPLKGTLYLYSILSFTNLALTQDVVDEVRAGQTGKMAHAVGCISSEWQD
jgi:hypothetical protein